MGFRVKKEVESRAYSPSLQVNHVNNSAGPIDVKVEKALSVPTFFSCLRLISESIAALPITCKQGSTPIPMCSFIKTPSQGTTHLDWVSQMLLSLMIDGNGFSAMIRNSDAEPTGMVVLPPDNVQVLRDKSLNKYLLVTPPTGGPAVRLNYGEFIHISWLTLPGQIRGLSPLRLLSSTLETACEAQEHAVNSMKTGISPSAAVTFREDISDEGIDNFLNIFRRAYAGSGNAGKIVGLTDAVDLKPLSFSNKDAQFLESRQFTIPEIARIYGLPNFLVGDSQGYTYFGSGLQEMQTGLVNFNLRPLIRRFELALDEQIQLTDPDISTNIPLTSLTHGNFTAQVESYMKLKDSGVLTSDEARELLQLQPREL